MATLAVAEREGAEAECSGLRHYHRNDCQGVVETVVVKQATQAGEHSTTAANLATSTSQDKFSIASAPALRKAKDGAKMICTL